MIPHSKTLVEVPVVFENNDTVPWNLAGPVVIGLDDSEPGSVIYPIHVRLADVQGHLDLVFARNQGETRNVADKCLVTYPFFSQATRLKKAVGSEDALAMKVVECHASVEGRCRLI